MFSSLQENKPDPLIALIAAYNDDSRAEKIDLGVGVYQDEQGHTPVMAAVKKAEGSILETETTKKYLGMAGDPVFNELITKLLLGEALADSVNDRAYCIQTPGGSGALRIASEVIMKASPEVNVWVSTPTWANHIPLISGSGLAIKEYPYYDTQSNEVDFAAMLNVLSQVPAGDVVLLHGCCHNPSGADLTIEQWQQVADLALQQGFIPLIDIAYQGLGDGLEEDAAGVRLMVEQLPEVIVAFSCSKNFGLYRERVGATLFIAESNSQMARVSGQAMISARTIYSMPPSHGAAIVTTVLQNQELTALWLDELGKTRERIAEMRRLLVSKLKEKDTAVDFAFIAEQKGMFSFLGITPEQVIHLRDESAIYMAPSSRINIAGINHSNIDHLSSAISGLYR